MTIEDQIRRVKPGEALLILARAIDELRAAEPAEDPWAIPVDALVPTEESLAADRPQVLEVPNGANAEERMAYIQAMANLGPKPVDPVAVNDWELRRQEAYRPIAAAILRRTLDELGPEPTDAEEARAWQARRELAKDSIRLATPDIAVEHETLQKVPVGRGIELQLPPPTEKQERRRRQLGEQLGLQHEGWPVSPQCPRSPALDAFVKGGAIWLYHFDRDFCVQAPRPFRHALMLDAHETSPEDGKIIGSDLLKFEDAGEQRAMSEAEDFAKRGD